MQIAVFGVNAVASLLGQTDAGPNDFRAVVREAVLDTTIDADATRFVLNCPEDDASVGVLPKVGPA